MPHVAYFSLGSNVGERESQLRGAIKRLEGAGHVVSKSSFYATEPIEVTDQPWFLNCAIGLETTRSPEQLMAAALQTEHEMGRVRMQSKGPRTIDIDLLLYGDVIIDLPKLKIPHPAMHQRRFVLEPLAEIAPGAWHPVFQKTIRDLLDSLPAGQLVRRMASASDERPTINDGFTAK